MKTVCRFIYQVAGDQSIILQTKDSRDLTQPVDQDWTDAWSGAKTFTWSAVPLPLRQGRVYVSL